MIAAAWTVRRDHNIAEAAQKEVFRERLLSTGSGGEINVGFHQSIKSQRTEKVSSHDEQSTSSDDSKPQKQPSGKEEYRTSPSKASAAQQHVSHQFPGLVSANPLFGNEPPFEY